MGKVYKVKAFWDGEAKVWVAEGVDVPGLVTNAATIEKLMKTLKVMVPEMLEANGLLPAGQTEVHFKLTATITGIGKVVGAHRMKKGIKKDRIGKILKDFQGGKINKHEAMDKLDLDRVGDLLALCAEYEILPDKTPANWQSNPSAKPLEEFFTDEPTR